MFRFLLEFFVENVCGLDVPIAFSLGNALRQFRLLPDFNSISNVQKGSLYGGTTARHRLYEAEANM